MKSFSIFQCCTAELLGTAFLLATIVGSGIMAERLAGGNDAIALLGNTIPTGAILVVLITALGPVSGGHFNPAVTFVFWLRRGITASQAGLYTVSQVIGGFIGVVSAHIMFDETVIQFSKNVRTGEAQFFSEVIATFGLILTILATMRARENALAFMVGLYITAAYWFTASTSFANPAVTIARCFSDTFSGIRPLDAPFFVIAQFLGATVAWAVWSVILRPSPNKE